MIEDGVYVRHGVFMCSFICHELRSPWATHQRMRWPLVVITTDQVRTGDFQNRFARWLLFDGSDLWGAGLRRHDSRPTLDSANCSFLFLSYSLLAVHLRSIPATSRDVFHRREVSFKRGLSQRLLSVPLQNMMC